MSSRPFAGQTAATNTEQNDTKGTQGPIFNQNAAFAFARGLTQSSAGSGVTRSDDDASTDQTRVREQRLPVVKCRRRE